MLKIGDQAPLDVKVVDWEGLEVSLKDFAGSYVVVYFYPKDDTPGCTKEACNFRDISQELLDRNIKIVGISKDGVESHKKFISKYKLNFPLWSDKESKLISAFGTKTMLGTSRSTFIIDPNGKIVKVWEKVNPLVHGAEVLDFFEALPTSPATTASTTA